MRIHKRTLSHPSVFCHLVSLHQPSSTVTNAVEIHFVLILFREKYSLQASNESKDDEGAKVLHQNCSGNPLPLHLSDIGIDGAVPDNFYAFVKASIWQSHPLHTVIVPLCRGEKGARVWLCLSSSLFPFVSHFCHFSYKQPSATLWMASRRDWKCRSVVPILLLLLLRTIIMLCSWSAHRDTDVLGLVMEKLFFWWFLSQSLVHCLITTLQNVASLSYAVRVCDRSDQY